MAMDDAVVVIKMSEATKGPVAVFVGNKTEADAYMFRAIANSEGQVSKIDNMYGLAFEVTETVSCSQQVECKNGSRTKIMPKTIPVTYYMQRTYQKG